MAATAADVPNRYDVVINGVGYMTADLEDVKAQYGYTPTFVERQNVSGDYGDNQQDFWLTATQRDWRLGEQLRYARPNDQDLARRYWRGSAVDVTTDGQVSMRPAVASLTFPAAALAAGGMSAFSTLLFAASTTNLYEISGAGSVTDRGAHGAGSVSSQGLAPDYGLNRVFIGGQTKVRKYDAIGHTFADFSATPAIALAFLNNGLYGLGSFGSDLLRFDTAGVATTVFQWKDATGVNNAFQSALCPFGGKLLILKQASDAGADLWLYDGTGVARVAQFPPNFIAWMLTVVNGIVFISGSFVTENFGKFRSAVYYYANGQIGLLWRASTPTASVSESPCLAGFEGGVVFTDETEGAFLFYDPSTGGISNLGSFTPGGAATNVSWLSSNGSAFVHVRNSTTGYFFPSTSRPSSSTVTSSLFDFDSSLDKLFRGVKVDWDAASDGNGGSVDIAYRVNDVDGSYTTLQAGAVSGTEYLLSGISGRSISIKITLNKGTSTLGPVVKRVALRAAPRQLTFRKDTFVLNLTGRDGESPVQLRDGRLEASDGLALATALRSAATSATPISVTDEFGTFTAVIEMDGFELRRVRANEFLAIVPVREV